MLEYRFYIGSIGADAQRFAWAVRNHWGIENRLHWCLDIAFREDESRVLIVAKVFAYYAVASIM